MAWFQKFRWKILNFLSWNLWNFQSWTLQLKSLLQTNVAKPIFWSIGLPSPPHLHPVSKNASDCRQGNFPHSPYYPPFCINVSHIPFRIIPHFTFRIPHAAIPHFTNNRDRWFIHWPVRPVQPVRGLDGPERTASHSTQLNSTSNYRRRWLTPQCPHLSSQYCITDYSMLISWTDLSPIPVRSAVNSYLTTWCIQNLAIPNINYTSRKRIFT